MEPTGEGQVATLGRSQERPAARRCGFVRHSGRGGLFQQPRTRL